MLCFIILLKTILKKCNKQELLIFILYEYIIFHDIKKATGIDEISLERTSWDC